MAKCFVNLFPLWAVLLSMVAFQNEHLFASFKTAIVPLLALVMFSMGMTLKWQDFKTIMRRPWVILLAMVLQFVFMPLFAWLISLALSLPLDLMTGMILVGCSAGGTASNVICYLAGGNLALSIVMTMMSTLVAVFLMPLLTFLYLHQQLSVPVGSMLQSLLYIVLLPVFAGTLINTVFNKKLGQLQTFFPVLSALAIILIIAIIVGLNQEKLANLALPVLIAVVLHNFSGLVIGYSVPRWFGLDHSTAKTTCIEVAMQNSGLSVALAIQYFSATAALPGALFSIWHNLSGGILAWCWRRKDSR